MQGIRTVVDVQLVLDSVHHKVSFCYPVSHAAHRSADRRGTLAKQHSALGLVLTVDGT